MVTLKEIVCNREIEGELGSAHEVYDPAVAAFAKPMVPFWSVPGAPEGLWASGSDPLARKVCEASLKPSGLARVILD